MIQELGDLQSFVRNNEVLEGLEHVGFTIKESFYNMNDVEAIVTLLPDLRTLKITSSGRRSSFPLEMRSNGVLNRQLESLKLCEWKSSVFLFLHSLTSVEVSYPYVCGKRNCQSSRQADTWLHCPNVLQIKLVNPSLFDDFLTRLHPPSEYAPYQTPAFPKLLSLDIEFETSNWCVFCGTREFFPQEKKGFCYVNPILSYIDSTTLRNLRLINCVHDIRFIRAPNLLTFRCHGMKFVEKHQSLDRFNEKIRCGPFRYSNREADKITIASLRNLTELHICLLTSFNGFELLSSINNLRDLRKLSLTFMYEENKTILHHRQSIRFENHGCIEEIKIQTKQVHKEFNLHENAFKDEILHKFDWREDMEIRLINLPSLQSVSIRKFSLLEVQNVPKFNNLQVYDVFYFQMKGSIKSLESLELNRVRISQLDTIKNLRTSENLRHLKLVDSYSFLYKSHETITNETKKEVFKSYHLNDILCCFKNLESVYIQSEKEDKFEFSTKLTELEGFSEEGCIKAFRHMTRLGVGDENVSEDQENVHSFIVNHPQKTGTETDEIRKVEDIGMLQVSWHWKKEKEQKTKKINVFEEEWEICARTFLRPYHYPMEFRSIPNNFMNLSELTIVSPEILTKICGLGRLRILKIEYPRNQNVLSIQECLILEKVCVLGYENVSTKEEEVEGEEEDDVSRSKGLIKLKKGLSSLKIIMNEDDVCLMKITEEVRRGEKEGVF